MIIPIKNSFEWHFIKGSSKVSIANSRFWHLNELALKQKDFKLSIKNINSNEFTRWKSFTEYKEDTLMMAYDIHRNMLNNEIIIESDAVNYEENRKIMWNFGQMLEKEGWIPHYYFSGSKSIHCHIFIDYTKLFTIEEYLQKDILFKFQTPEEFKKVFIEWLRERLITWKGMDLFPFDKNLIKSTHLIRSEMSMNKLGFKTFLGYTWQNIPENVPICNYETTEYPNIAIYSNCINVNEFPIKESFCNDLNSLIKDFLANYERIILERNSRLKMAEKWENYKPKKIRANIQKILDNPEKILDGKQRCMFLLANELKQIYGPVESEKIMLNWNLRLLEPLEEKDIKFRLYNSPKYKISNKYINEILKELNL